MAFHDFGHIFSELSDLSGAEAAAPHGNRQQGRQLTGCRFPAAILHLIDQYRIEAALSVQHRRQPFRRHDVFRRRAAKGGEPFRPVGRLGNGLSEVVQAKWLGETLDLSGLPVTSSTSAAPAEDDRANAETGANGSSSASDSPSLEEVLAEGQAASSGASDTGEAGSNAVSLEEATGVSSGQSEEDAQ